MIFLDGLTIDFLIINNPSSTGRTREISWKKLALTCRVSLNQTLHKSYMNKPDSHRTARIHLTNTVLLKSLSKVCVYASAINGALPFAGTWRYLPTLAAD